jgi:hypothetical protein
MATEENFLQSYDLDEANKLLESSPEPADRVLEDEEAQDAPSTAPVVSDEQAREYPEDEDVKMEDMDVDAKLDDPEVTGSDPLGLSRFGPLYLKALKRLLDNHEPFLRSDKSAERPMYWSQSMKVEKLAQFHEASKAALDEMLVEIYKDRNVLFREAPDSGPTADPIDPVLGAKVAQKAAAERPANSRCACATVHRAIFTCPVGAQDHPQLCITVANYRNSMMEPAKPPITFRKADASAVKPIPKKQTPSVKSEEPSSTPSAETFKQPQQKRGRDPSRGRGRGGNRNNGPSRDQSQDSHPDNKKRRRNNNRNSQNAQRRIGRSRERSQTPAEPTNFNPEFFRQLFTSVLTPPTTPVSIPAPVSDPRVRPSPTPPSATVTKATFTPSEHGDKVIRRPDGKIDWRYAPVQPSDLPPDRKFDADVRDGHWCVRISKK